MKVIRQAIPDPQALQRAKQQYWLTNLVLGLAVIVFAYVLATIAIREYQAWQASQPATVESPAPIPTIAPRLPVQPPAAIEQPAAVEAQPVPVEAAPIEAQPAAEPSAPNLPAVPTTSIEMIVDDQFVPAPPEPTLVPGSSGGGGSSGGSTWGTP